MTYTKKLLSSALVLGILLPTSQVLALPPVASYIEEADIQERQNLNSHPLKTNQAHTVEETSKGFFQKTLSTAGRLAGAVAGGYASYLYSHFIGREAYDLCNNWLEFAPKKTFFQRAIYVSEREFCGDLAQQYGSFVLISAGAYMGSKGGEALGWLADQSLAAAPKVAGALKNGTYSAVSYGAHGVYRAASYTAEEVIVPGAKFTGVKIAQAASSAWDACKTMGRKLYNRFFG